MWSLEEESAKSLQLCLTLWDPMDCSPSGSSVHEILQARIQACVENLVWYSCWVTLAKLFCQVSEWSRSGMSDSLRPHGLWPTRLLCPWDFPGNSTDSERSKRCLWGKDSILERMEWMLPLVAWLGGCSLHLVPWEGPLCPPCPPPHASQASRDDSLIVRPHGVTERWPGQEGSLSASDARVGLYA